LSIIVAVKLPKGTITKIIGMSNQRVKECNRIEKVVQLLAIFHILAYELDDGIAIMSNPSILKMQKKVLSVPTFNDHRLAMAFTILSVAVCDDNKVIIEDARTVEKTFPQFWSHIKGNVSNLLSTMPITYS